MTKPSIANDFNSPATKADVEAAKTRNDNLMTGVVIVLFIGFISTFITGLGLIIDAWRFKAETYQNLVNQVATQNAKIDILTNKIHSLFGK